MNLRRAGQSCTTYPRRKRRLYCIRGIQDVIHIAPNLGRRPRALGQRLTPCLAPPKPLEGDGMGWDGMPPLSGLKRTPPARPRPFIDRSQGGKVRWPRSSFSCFVSLRSPGPIGPRLEAVSHPMRTSWPRPARSPPAATPLPCLTRVLADLGDRVSPVDGFCEREFHVLRPFSEAVVVGG